MEEMAKTLQGQARIAAAAERLDRTSAAMGEQYRDDVPQGETAAMGQHSLEQPPNRATYRLHSDQRRACEG